MIEVPLGKPLEHDGKQVASLSLDMDKLTGADFMFAEREALSENANVPALDPRLSPAFQAQIAARASGVPVEALRKLAVRDYAEVLTQVRNFFLVGG